MVCTAALFAQSAVAAPNITSGDIVDGEVKTVDIGASAVTSAKIQDGAVTTSKLEDGAVTAAKLAGQVYTQAQVDAIVASLQQQISELQDLLQHFSRTGNEIYVSGANVHILNAPAPHPPR